MRYSFFLITIVLSLTVQAQKSFTLSGHIQDESSGEQLIGATIYAKEVNEGNYSGSANNSTNLQSATNVVLMGGERIEGPIYAFTMTTGSCLTYMF